MDLTPPPSPSKLILEENVSSVDIFRRPEVRVQGLKSGQKVKIFKDKDCSFEVAETESLGTEAFVEASDYKENLPPGDFELFAKSLSSSGNLSSCSSAKVSYTRLPYPNEL